MAFIMIVEDDPAINDLVSMNLNLIGHESIQIYNGNEVSAAISRRRPDLIILDEMIPGLSGFSLMEKDITDGIPVIFLTARTSLSDRIKGLKLGADDYIQKPFETLELLARIEAVLRRTMKNSSNDSCITIGEAQIFLNERKATLKGLEVDLTNREFELLEVLILNRNLALSREKLLNLAWGYEYYGETRTVDAHINKLRKKLNLDGYIKTIFKMGYRLEV